jgi:hypothetical protein
MKEIVREVKSMTIRTGITLLAFLLGTCPTSRPQAVKTDSDGQQVLRLTVGQQAAVDLFLSSHLDLVAANCSTTGPEAAWCRTSSANWRQAVEAQGATPQYQFAAWGDSRGGGLADLAIPFHVRKVGPGSTKGEIVVFENLGSDRYRPHVALTENWGGCFDGILFHPTRKRFEFWCNSASGYVFWNGSNFVGKLVVGD